MRKIFFVIFISLFFIFQVVATAQDDDFYSVKFLKSDFKQADAVVRADVKKRELADKIGDGDCEKSVGTGYCLYRLKGKVIEVFKGKIRRKNFEFYEVTDLNYSFKDRLLGAKIVFLNWSNNYPDRKMSLGTIENSTREIKHGAVGKLRKIAFENKRRINRKPVPKKVRKAAR